MRKRPVIAPQAGKQELAFNLNVDVLIYGGAAGSGKSRLLLMKPLQYIQDPNFNCVFFRRTTKALEKAGSLWPESKKLYTAFKTRVREKDHQHIFKNGAIISMDHLEHENDAEGNHQGTQYSGILFDELTHFSQTQFLYLIGRMRSEAGADSFCMATCNPDYDSWVYDWVEWYLDDSEEGYPDPAKCGVVRYFVIVEDKPVFANTQEELIEEYPDLCYQTNKETGEVDLVPPLSFAFIGGTIYDNPALLKANPKYLAALKSQTRVNRARLLDGAWRVRAEGSSLWTRKWIRGEHGEKVKHYSDIPPGCTEVRAWDKGYSEPSETNPYPDFTAASPKFYRTKEGLYYLVGDYIPEAFDIKQKGEPLPARVLGKFRKLAGERDVLITRQAQSDGEDCAIVLTKDSGAGMTDHTYTKSILTAAGFKVIEDTSAKNTPNKKVTDFQPFANACSLGLVFIVEESFNKKTLDAFYKQLEAFDGTKSTGLRKDDWVDSCSMAFNAIAGKTHIPKFSLGIGNKPTTKLAQVKATAAPVFG